MADDITADTQREYLAREVARNRISDDTVRRSNPTHGEDGEVLPHARVIVWKARPAVPDHRPRSAPPAGARSTRSTGSGGTSATGNRRPGHEVG